MVLKISFQPKDFVRFHLFAGADSPRRPINFGCNRQPFAGAGVFAVFQLTTVAAVRPPDPRITAAELKNVPWCGSRLPFH
jgi:hypothetical protein